MGKTLWSSILDDLPDPTHRIWATPPRGKTSRTKISKSAMPSTPAISSWIEMPQRRAPRRGFGCRRGSGSTLTRSMARAWICLNDVVEEACVSGAFDIEEDAP